MLTFFNRKWFKSIKYVAMCGLMLAASAFSVLAEHGPTHGRFSHMPMSYVHAVGWVGIVFFGFCLLYFIYMQVKYAILGRKPIECTKEGLLNRDAFIPWNTIEKITLSKYGIVIKTNDEEERLSKSSLLKRWRLRSAKRSSGGLFMVNSYDFSGTRQEFYDYLMAEWQRAKSQ